MNANDCRTARQEIDQSELGQRLSEQTESHLIVCATCAVFRAERTRLRELVGSLLPVTAPADFDVRLRARIARERDAGSAQPSIFRLFMSTPAIAVAAVIVMIVGGVVWMNQRANRNPTPSATNQPGFQNPGTPATATNQTSPANDQTLPTTSNKDSSPTIDNQKLASVSRRNLLKPSTIASGTQSSDFNVSGARSYPLNPDRAGEVSLSAPVKPMVITVYNEKGGSRKILLPPITFGAQRLTDKTTPVSMTNTRDW